MVAEWILLLMGMATLFIGGMAVGYHWGHTDGVDHAEADARRWARRAGHPSTGSHRAPGDN